MPRDDFIHVDNFLSPKEQANQLTLLHSDEEMNLQYFDWRRHFNVKRSHFCANTHVVPTINSVCNNLDTWIYG